MSDVFNKLGPSAMDSAAESEYEAVKALLNGGARLNPGEAAKIESSIAFYAQQGEEEYEAGEN